MRLSLKYLAKRRCNAKFFKDLFTGKMYSLTHLSFIDFKVP